MRACMTIFLAMFWAVLLVPTDAFAYLDPATGTAIVQGLLALLGAIAVALRIFWHRIAALFKVRGSATRGPK